MPGLEQVTDAAVDTVELLRIVPIELPHGAGQVRLERLGQQVVVVVHQHVPGDRGAEGEDAVHL